MSRFIGRNKELKQINELTRIHKASLVVIKGRRRIGKSRLAIEFAEKLSGYKTVYITGMAPEDGVTAQKEREDFAEQLSQQLKVAKPNPESWNTLLWSLSDHTQSGKWVIILDEINWLGRKDPAFLSQLKSTWDRDFSKNKQLILILSGSISSWISKNILHSTGFLGRIDLDLTLDELSLSESTAFLQSAHNHISAYEALKILAVTGGVPSYLEQIDCTQPAENNLQRLCFRESGFLHREFENLFHDLFQDRQLYRNIIEALADKPLTLEELYATLGISKSGYISRALDDLSQNGFIDRHFTWSLKSNRPSNLSKIRIIDNYTRFYFKGILPNLGKIKRGFDQLPKNFYSLLGLQFENLILKNRASIWERLRLNSDDIVMEGPYFQRTTQRSPGCQIDYLIQCQHNTLYIVEIKFHRSLISSGITQEVEKKISSLSRPKGYSCRPVLIHVNGVDDSVIDSEYFDEIIDLSDLLEA